MFGTITALHQQIRELVESQEPDYKVTSIDSYGITEYLPPLDKQSEIHPAHVEYVHVMTNLRFKVHASRPGLAGRHYKLSIEVHVASDGTLILGDRLASY